MSVSFSGGEIVCPFQKWFLYHHLGAFSFTRETRFVIVFATRGVKEGLWVIAITKNIENKENQQSYFFLKKVRIEKIENYFSNAV